MSLISLFFLIAGAALLAFGFKRNNRTVLAVAAVVWLATGSWSEISQGFNRGADQGAKDALGDKAQTALPARAQ